MILDELIVTLQILRDRHGAGTLPVRVFDPYGDGDDYFEIADDGVRGDQTEIRVLVGTRITGQDDAPPECPADGDVGYPSGEGGLWLCSSCGRELHAT